MKTRIVFLTEEEATRVAGLLRLGGGPTGKELADKIMDSESFDSDRQKLEIKDIHPRTGW